jgi:hypothetical protein
MKTVPDSTSFAAAMRIAIAITTASACLGACSGGCGGCSGSRGCGGCTGGDRVGRNDPNRQPANQGASTPATRAVAQAITAPTGSGPACDEAAMRCTYRFAYVDHGETSAEVRGDFRAGAWTRGVPMTKRGKTWTADVDVPYGRDVQYKLYLDGERWLRDPAAPAAPGGDSSRLDSVTCNPHRCQAP